MSYEVWKKGNKIIVYFDIVSFLTEGKIYDEIRIIRVFQRDSNASYWEGSNNHLPVEKLEVFPSSKICRQTVKLKQEQVAIFVCFV